MPKESDFIVKRIIYLLNYKHKKLINLKSLIFQNFWKSRQPQVDIQLKFVGLDLTNQMTLGNRLI
jgi:hypothetical protein